MASMAQDRDAVQRSPAAAGRAATPTWLPCDPAGIPRELTDAEAWYPALIRPKADKPGKYDKIPGDPATGTPARWSDKATRCTFGAAFMAYQSGRFPGVGYMMDAGAGVIGIDLDDSLNPDDTLKPWAQEIVDDFPGAYWERSIGGKGLRGFCRGSLPVGGCRDKIEGSSVELYAAERFLVVTGQALEPVETLPTLQDAVDRLHARLTAGKVRATGTAVATGLRGRNADPSPEASAIVGDLLGGPHAEWLSGLWGRDDEGAAGASEEDWTLEKAAVKAARARGHAGDALARIVEEVLRTGPYRKKWDEKRGDVTWLAQDVANAIATVEEERKAPKLVLKGDTAPADPLETPGQIIARLERELEWTRRALAVATRPECDGDCPTAVALRDELREYHIVDRWLRDKVLSAELAGVARQYASDVSLALATGKPRVATLAEKVVKERGGSPATVTRFNNRLREIQADPELAAALPFRLAARGTARRGGKDHTDLVVAEAPAARRTVDILAALDGPLRATATAGRGGAREERRPDWWCPRHPDAPHARSTSYRCTEEGCTHAVQRPTATIDPPETSTLYGATFATVATAPPAANGQFQTDEHVLENGMLFEIEPPPLEALLARLGTGEPVSFVTDHDREQAHGAARYRVAPKSAGQFQTDEHGVGSPPVDAPEHPPPAPPPMPAFWTCERVSDGDGDEAVYKWTG
jgi:hypothetical protein